MAIPCNGTAAEAGDAALSGRIGRRMLEGCIRRCTANQPLRPEI